ncbi:MAG: hypothetical protein D6815_11940 [Candidatus Dadabacteria bacterium]|nr:MAG: hypothetical protein D6815_11940 [Candidatus Dadabacteria bacterium]
MGLVARFVEAAGIPTLTMSVGRDITERVVPPRAVFLDYPMGNEIGRPHQLQEQRAIIRAAFAAAAEMKEPGTILDLPFALEATDEQGRDWREWVYTKGFRARHMKTREGGRWPDESRAPQADSSRTTTK